MASLTLNGEGGGVTCAGEIRRVDGEPVGEELGELAICPSWVIRLRPAAVHHGRAFRRQHVLVDEAADPLALPLQLPAKIKESFA